MLSRTRERIQKTSERLVGLTFAAESLKETVKMRPLSREKLKLFAEEFPQWAVGTGIHEGAPVKTYSRIMSDMSQKKLSDHNTLVDLTDSEFFDSNLKSIFEEKGSWTSGWGYTSGPSGNISGQFTVSVIEFPEAAITYGDIERVARAEEYVQATYMAGAVPTLRAVV